MKLENKKMNLEENSNTCMPSLKQTISKDQNGNSQKNQTLKHLIHQLIDVIINLEIKH